MKLNLNAGWSYSTQQILNIIPHLKVGNIKILELGSGESTSKIYDYFSTLFPKVTFYSFETSEEYLCRRTDINSVLYDTVENCILPNEKFDLILVDGPTGEVRNKWYAKIKEICKKDTIIHIDDFCHYDSFSTNLDSNFEYTTLDYMDRANTSEHCWKTVRVLL